MNSYYTQTADKIFPIFGVNSLDEAKQFTDGKAVIETSDQVLMSLDTGSVDFSSNWEAEGVNLSDLIEVTYDINQEGWVESKK